MLRKTSSYFTKRRAALPMSRGNSGQDASALIPFTVWILFKLPIITRAESEVKASMVEITNYGLQVQFFASHHPSFVRFLFTSFPLQNISPNSRADKNHPAFGPKKPKVGSTPGKLGKFRNDCRLSLHTIR